MHRKSAKPGSGHRFSSLGRRVGLIAAVWAVIGQIAFADLMQVEAMRVLLGAQNVICHVGDGGTAPTAPHHGTDCDTCPLCQAFAEASLLAGPAASPALPGPSLAWQRRGNVSPPARAPPALVLAGAWPRGPPA
ncbi:hypothetical protein [Acidibrevibacterium fodinaquatile]|uniref:hypothetical protein n=1 Tax=Acidibrevibacterium fodinaquatile TaxID=1969806 RepID=UPI0013B47524|nr:hypothetical protein [Acidibrevibacterium fodinaquatile]